MISQLLPRRFPPFARGCFRRNHPLLWAVFATLLLASAAPASATTLLAVAITTAVTAQTTTPVQFRDGPPLHVTVQCNFVYGSGGTTAKAWIETSFDAVTWNDTAPCSFTTSSAINTYNFSALTVHTTAVVPTDGSASTAVDGVIGPWWRVKYTTTGTYAGTTLNVDVSADRSFIGTSP